MSRNGSTPILVTGAAGFIGFHLAERLLRDGHRVLGVDNVNAYYDVRLKEARLERLREHSGFEFEKRDLSDREPTAELFQRHSFERVVHLAAQAGVRHSLDHPNDYIDSNVVAFQNVLEGCRHSSVPHLVFASSSSVYGSNRKLPFSEHDPVDHPISLYAATKRANELQAHCYSWLYGIPTTGLRFFSVYGPWGRPDMALFIFAKAIAEGRPIELFNDGRMVRDFTYVDDIVEGVVRVMSKPPSPTGAESAVAADLLDDPASSTAPFRILNIGNSRPVELERFISAIERCLGKDAKRVHRPMQPGDVAASKADIGDLERTLDYRPEVDVEEGVRRFITWYREYYRC